jgi:hypothetical protein
MNMQSVILQIKALAPIFSGNVAGAARFAEGISDQTWLPQPAAYVMPTEESVSPNEQMNGLRQIITERFEVVVSLDNRADRRGQSAAETLDTYKSAIFKAILGWRPDSSADAPNYQTGNPFVDRSSRGLRYAGGELREFDRARFFWAFIFELDVLIEAQWDGWTPTATPLTEIQVNAPEGSFGSFNVTIPQEICS